MLELVKLAHAKEPTMGARQLRCVLERDGDVTSRWTVGEMMEHLGLKALYGKPQTSLPEPGHPRYPYRLRGREMGQPDEMWAIDICLASLALRAVFGGLPPLVGSNIPWRRGHVYLAAPTALKRTAIDSEGGIGLNQFPRHSTRIQRTASMITCPSVLALEIITVPVSPKA